MDPAIDEKLKDFTRLKKDSMDDEWY